ncbi:GNAT family N-acetyltransferase [Paenibacillus rhizovicinus]|uniref:GNAT family N-acetyltransferase n=1 Tax=Paenibacillus rhizovicinus TaxID=2704463 RepID=A0A6C0P2S2_9BACL|nr:GNAT family N-acetyltransferase [Paenibacillus rhizovicinus]QHW32798.1 GNAT family N-acetyltransferase [Paenibacillus rhizovicinus]
MNEIRVLQHDDLGDSIELSAFAFQFELSADDKANRIAQADPGQTWGFFAEGKLAAKLQIIPFHTWVNGRRFAMGGIAGVATWPEYRRGGKVAQLLGHALKVMRDRGQTLSFLAPFKFEFYRKYGWETYVDYVQYEIPSDGLPKFKAAEGSSVVRVARDGELLNPIYESYAKQFNGMLERDAGRWSKAFFGKKGTAAIYLNPQGEARGYVFYQVRNSVATIHELVFLDEEARRGLWKFIADHDSMITKAEVKAPVDDQLPFLMQEPRFKQERTPYFMARIVDAEAFLTQYVYAARSGAEPLYLRISDPHADWNEGVYRMAFANGGTTAEVTKLAEGEAPEESEVLSCTIQTLTAMFMGYQRPGFMARIERLQGSQDSIDRLEAALPQRATYLADFF